jgi:hypothetical protein
LNVEELIHGYLSNATEPDLYDEVSLLLRAIGTPQYPNSIAEARGYLNDAKQRKVELMKLRTTSMIDKRKQPQVGNNNLRAYVNVAADDEDEQVDVEDKGTKIPATTKTTTTTTRTKRSRITKRNYESQRRKKIMTTIFT